MPAKRLTHALTEALREEMERDDHVIIIGEDVSWGLMGPTKGLVDHFGPERVRNTPVSEATVAGSGLGAALAGLRPVVDLMMSNFAYVCADQLINQAAKLRYMMGGAADFPVVYFMSTGIAGSAAGHHSDSVHPYFMNSGGVKVVLPSTAYDAKGLLKAAIRDPNPVVFLFHNLMGSETDDVPDGDYVVPLGRCRIRRSGSDTTVVASGLMAKRAMAAAEILEVDGISAEVVDPRTLHPLDVDGIVDSVKRTGRLIAVDEARRTCSAASEIVARVSQYAWEHLVAPPQVVAVEDVPIPFAPVLEREVVPSAEQIVSSVKRLLGAERGRR